MLSDLSQFARAGGREPGDAENPPDALCMRAKASRQSFQNSNNMKFEKISDEKFQNFKKSEVVNPILICGGWAETDSGDNHDRYVTTGGVATSVDSYQQTLDGQNFTQDQATTSDHDDYS